jgi:hypothetical protein
MPKALPILFGAAFTLAACVAAGTFVLRSLALKFHRGEERLFGFVVGSACWSLLVFLLAAAGQARPGMFLAAGLLMMLLAFRTKNRAPAETLPPLERPWKWFFALLFALYSVLYFFNAMAPEISPDGSSYHLGFVARYFRERGLVRITTSMYANISQGMEMLFLSAFAFGRHSAASLVHFAFLLALPLSMLCYARRFGLPKAGVAGALLVYLSPVAGAAGTSAYNDMAVACVVFALFYLLQIWDEQRNPALLVPVGLLAGFAYALKYTAAVAILYGAGFVGWKLWRARRPLVRPLLVLGACAFAMMAPWIVRNWIWFANPFSPFFNSLFPNPYIHISFEKEYSERMRHYEGLGSYRDIPMEAAVRGGVLQGFLGPMFLLAPLGLLALRGPAGRRLLLAWLVFTSTFPANVGTRFLLPGLPFLSLAMGMAFMNSRGVPQAVLLAHALISWPSLHGIYCDPYAWRLMAMPEHAALRRSPEERFLSEKLYEYKVARMVEQHVPPGAKVFAFNQTADAYTSREVLVAYQAALNNILSDIVYAAVLHDFQPIRRLRAGFAPAKVRRIRLVQTGSGAELWGVNELRVFRNGGELPRSPAWRLRAHPKPWDVQMAFDNSPVTRWRSWEARFPGMYLEIDFGAPQEVDSVLVECAPDQIAAVVKVEGEIAPGQWKTLSSALEAFEIPSPAGLRRAAAEELKARGVDYLLEHDSDFLAKDFAAQRRSWGLTELGHIHGARLYRID